jgi:hypothetical protein
LGAKHISVSTRKGIVDFGNHRNTIAVFIIAKPKADWLELIAQHPRISE